MLGGILLILFCQLGGEVLVRSLGLPLPGPVAGMVLLLGVVIVYRDVPATLRSATDGLLRYLALLFVPIAVTGIMAHRIFMYEIWFPLTVAILGSTILGIITTALVFRLLMRRQQRSGRSAS